MAVKNRSKKRVLYIQYFTGKVMRHFEVVVPTVKDSPYGYMDSISCIANEAIYNFDEEGGTYEKKTS